uniref:Uncharacterized protein n=1 Tax=Spongospora subterranea TaxID=70186 RepID=A0A0H5QS88_9EUKA|eukprot:CRZ04883.1 hypothetical protein [Spongospora subterranea]
MTSVMSLETNALPYAEGHSYDSNDDDALLKSFWDLVPEIADLFRNSTTVKLGIVIDSEEEWKCVAVNDESNQVVDAVSMPSMAASIRTLSTPVPAATTVKNAVRTPEQKRAEIMALWKGDSRYQDLIDCDTLIVVDDNDADNVEESPQASMMFEDFAQQYFATTKGGLLSPAVSSLARARHETKLGKSLLCKNVDPVNLRYCNATSYWRQH